MSELRQFLGAKERRVEDLIRFVGTRTDQVPNYTLLLGAGASISSGIRSATSLIQEWRREMYFRCNPEAIHEPYEELKAKEFLSRNQSQWYSTHREYSSLFEKKFDLPRQRRMFVENEVASKMPSLGYAYLVRLFQGGYFNTVFTTNFDDLLNEAFHQFSDLRPIICAHDSSISSITVTAKRPKIVKIHGDYLFDDIKSTVRETESLEENTKKKIAEFAKDHGLIVVGYGGNDRSVMDVLQSLLKQDEYFKHGIYWCVRKGERPSEDLIKLLWKDRAYFVEFDGFDELMASIYHATNGDGLPINTSMVSEKPREAIKRFCSDQYLLKSPSSEIKKDLTKLQRLLDQEALADSWRKLVSSDDDRESAPGVKNIGDSQLVQLLMIRQSISANEYQAALGRVNSELQSALEWEYREELLKLKIDVEVALDNRDSALLTCETLIQSDANNAAHYLAKAKLEIKCDRALSAIEQALAADPYLPSAYRLKCEALTDKLNGDPAANGPALCQEILKAYEDCFELNPSIANKSWPLFFRFVQKAELPKQQKKALMDEALRNLECQDAYSLMYLELSLMRAAVFEEDRSGILGDQVLAKIEQALSLQARGLKVHYELFLLKAFKELGRYSKLKSAFINFDAREDILRQLDYVMLRSWGYLNLEGKIHDAIRVLENFDGTKKIVAACSRLIGYYLMAGRIEDAKAALADSQKIFDADEKLQLEESIFCEQRDFDKALATLKRRMSRSDYPYEFAVSESHHLLKMGQFSEAATVARKYLEITKFNPRDEALIVNYELAQFREKKKVDKARLSKLIETAGDAVKICAYLLLDNEQKARECFEREVENHFENLYTMREWAIFDPPSFHTWFSEVTRGRVPDERLLSDRAVVAAAG